MNYVFVVSDSTGKTAERALRAALVQFSAVNIEIKLRPEVQEEEQVRQVVQEANDCKGFIVHTLVSDKLRKVMFKMGRLHNVETIDLMGPLLTRLSKQLSISPSEKPGLFRELGEEYFRRVETVEFAIHHDDGMRTHELHKAEIVLVGVSRTFKTLISVYMAAFKGWFVANVPIVIGIDPPPILFNLPPSRIFGLTTEPWRLAELRQARHKFFGRAIGDYAEHDYVSRELRYALSIFSRNPEWSIINVAGKSIEEIASEILTLVEK